MKLEKLQELFQKGINSLMTSGSSGVFDFLNMCASGNLFSLSFENQILVYAQNKNVKFLQTYDGWKEHGRIPLGGSAIHLFPGTNNVSRWCFDVSTTVNRPGMTEEFQVPDFNEYDKMALVNLVNEGVEKNYEICVGILTRTLVRGMIETENDNLLSEQHQHLISDFCNYVVLRRMGREFSLSMEQIEAFTALKEMDVKRIMVMVQSISKRLISVVFNEMSARIIKEKVEGGKNYDEKVDGGRSTNDGQHEYGGGVEVSGMRGAGGNADSRIGESGPVELRQTGSGFHRGEVSAVRTDALIDGRIEDDRTAETNRSDRNDGAVGEGVLQDSQVGGFHDESSDASRGESNRARGGEQGDFVQEPLDVKNSSDYFDETEIILDEEFEEDSEEAFEQLSLFGLPERKVAKPAEPKNYHPISKTLEKNIPVGYVTEVLLRGSGYSGGKARIIEMYNKNMTSKERAAAIKKEYGLGGAGWPLDGYGVRGYDTFHAKGLHIEWRDEKGEKEGYLSWSDVEKYIHDMVKMNTYWTESDEREKTREENYRIMRLVNQGIYSVYQDVLASGSVTEDETLDKLAVIRFLGDAPLLRYREFFKNVFGANIGFDMKQFFVKTFFEKFSDKYMTYSDMGGYIRTDVTEGCLRLSYVPALITVESKDHSRHETDMSYETFTYIMDSVINDESYKIPDISDLASYQKKISEEFLGFYNAFADKNGLPAMEVNVADIVARKKENGTDKSDVILDYEAEQELNEAVDVGANDNTAVVTEILSEVPEQIIEAVVRGKEYHYPEGWQPNNGNDKSRFAKNIEAIKVLKSIEQESRPATEDEQEILSKYVGWGGLSAAFDESKTEWSAEYEELKQVLTDEEYVSARATVNDSFYTPVEVMKGIYAALSHMGFEKGNILEPSMGIGNFYNAMPESMAHDSKLYGVEIDSISGRIAKQLHPHASIQITGIERASLPENFFNVVIGNIPFGDYQVFDAKYKKQNFLIHDYFIAKSIDLLAPGGVMCVITSKGTMDKRDNRVRKYIAERADLIGAIRLPDNAFKSSANTEVTSDILFFKKKDKMVVSEPDWVNLGYLEDGIVVNDYFVQNPNMMLGTMTKVSGRFGETVTLAPNTETPFEQQLDAAVNTLPENVYEEFKVEDAEEMEENMIPADPGIKNYTFGLVDGQLFYRENAYMYRPKLNAKAEARIKGMCTLKSLLRTLIERQLDDCTETELCLLQKELNDTYDSFVEKYGYINEHANQSVFACDVDAPLLSALEEEKDKEIVKAKIFTERTIHPNIQRTSADTALEALNISLNELGYVNIRRMLELYPVELDTLKKELVGEIYLNPLNADSENEYEGYETAEEYLSGNVRQKLRVAETYAEKDERYKENVMALQKVQPKDLEAGDIDVKIGTPWISIEDYERFIYETFNIPHRNERNSWDRKRQVIINFEPISNTYYITNKSEVNHLSYINTVYGTYRMNALEVMERLLNMQEITVRDRIDEPDGSHYYVVNQQETIAARDKAEVIKQQFRDWIFNDIDRREKYVKYYNETFNAVRVREYNGSMLTFPGKSMEYNLRSHQKDAVARIIRGGNALLAHCVGAGKSFEMAAACMELRRLGLAYKPVIVVPNHLTGQMASEFMSLYPSASVLLTTKKEFEKKRRQKFIAKIATGDYDAVIMGHSQFEKIGLSPERKKGYIEREIEEINASIASMKGDNNEKWTVKQMESQKKRLEAMIEKEQRDEYKDDIITFEELGIDCVMIDEAHLYKNLSFSTKMSRVAGINPSGSKKAMDLFMKIQYLGEINPGRNVVFATGTPISNSMAEMYIMQKYLQPDLLKEKGIYHFDAWAAAYGETVTAMELAPEGSGYRQKTRFAKFINIPELVAMFREVADIKTIDMLPDIKRPSLKDGKYDVVESVKTEEMDAYMEQLVERARLVRDGVVDPEQDNMLKVCHDARLMSADMRLIDPTAENHPDSKLNECVKNLLDVYRKTDDYRGIQIVFCDIGVPNKEGKFCVYDYIKSSLIENGIPAEEICYIHDAGTDESKKQEMFATLRSGERRIIIGSTEKMGTGTNIQERLAAMHEIDVPWRPSDVEQREGRILRQGNMHEEVEIFRYVTKGTFDAYNWSIIENKQRFISQIMNNSSVIERSCEDVDEAVMTYAEMKAIASDNPLIKEKMELDMELQKLKVLREMHNRTRYDIERRFKRLLPDKKEKLQQLLSETEKDIHDRNEYRSSYGEKEKIPFIMSGQAYESKEDAAKILSDHIETMKIGETVMMGNYCGFEVGVRKEYVLAYVSVKLVVRGAATYVIDASESPAGNLQRIVNAIDKFDAKKDELIEQIQQCDSEIEQLETEFKKPFEQEEIYNTKLKRQRELEVILSQDNKKDDSLEKKRSL